MPICTPYWAKGNATLYHGDVVECLRRMPTRSVHCCVTSPPYWGLRDYGTGTWEGGSADCDHVAVFTRGDTASKGKSGARLEGVGVPALQLLRGVYPPVYYKGTCAKCGATRTDHQIGMEDTPEEYINQMVKVFNEVRRVLRNDGTLWLNLGDTFDNGQQLIPARVALALVADGWKLIQDIIWYAPNKMPESVTNRCTKSHEHIFLLSKGNDYYFDSVAIHKVARMTDEIDTLQRTKGGFAKNDSITVGANKRDVWIVPTQHLKMRDDLTPEQKTYVVGELIRRGLL